MPTESGPSGMASLRSRGTVKLPWCTGTSYRRVRDSVGRSVRRTSTLISTVPSTVTPSTHRPVARSHTRLAER